MKKIMIKTDRLIIRNFDKKDVQAILELWSKPLVNCYVPEKMETLEQAYQYIDNADKEYDFAVCLKDTDEMIGVLFGRLEEPDTFSPCWNFIPAYFGKGYATEAATAYFDYLFTAKNMRRLYSFTEDNNIASQRLCRRLGMREEGLFKEFISFVKNPDGTPKYENTYQFAILKKEFRKSGLGTLKSGIYSNDRDNVMEVESMFICYPKCSTCQKAKKWLIANNIEFTERHIVENNPTYDELKEWLVKSGLPVKRFFNTSGNRYKELMLKDKLPDMSEDEMLHLLSTDGMLVKRPLFVYHDTVLVGIREKEWEEALR